MHLHDTYSPIKFNHEPENKPVLILRAQPLELEIFCTMGKIDLLIWIFIQTSWDLGLYWKTGILPIRTEKGRREEEKRIDKKSKRERDKG